MEINFVAIAALIFAIVSFLFTYLLDRKRHKVSGPLFLFPLAYIKNIEKYHYGSRGSETIFANKLAIILHFQNSGDRLGELFIKSRTCIIRIGSKVLTLIDDRMYWWSSQVNQTERKKFTFDAKRMIDRFDPIKFVVEGYFIDHEGNSKPFEKELSLMDYSETRFI